MIRKFLLLLPVIFVYTLASAQYESKSFKKWSDLYRNGQREKLEKSLIKELNKSTPNEMAVYVWVNLHFWQDSVPTTMFSQKVAAQIQWMVEAQRNYEHDRTFLNTRNTAAQDMHVVGGFPYHLVSWENVNDKNGYELTKRHMEGRQKDLFAFVWTLTAYADDNFEIFETLKADLEAGHFKEWPTIEEYLRGYTKVFGGPAREKIRLTIDYLKEHQDPLAYRFVGKQFLTTMHYEEAARYFQQSIDINPFYESNYSDLAFAQAMQLDYSGMEKTLRAFVEISAQAPAQYHAYEADALRRAQDYGRAVIALEKGLGSEGDKDDLYLCYMRMKNAEKDIPELLHTAELFNYKTPNYNFYGALVELIDKEGQTVLELLEAVEQRDGGLNQGLEIDRVQALVSLEEQEMALEYLQMGNEKYPDSRYFNWEYANQLESAGENELAIQFYKRTLQLEPDISAVWTSLRKLEMAVVPEAGILGPSLSEGLQRHKELEAVWSAFAEVFVSGSKARTSIWKQSLEKNPTYGYPLKELRNALTSERKFDELLELFERYEDSVLMSDNYQEISTFYYHWGYSLVDKSKYIHLDSAEVQLALKCFDLNEQYYGMPWVAEQGRYNLYLAMGDEELAGVHCARAIDQNPNAYRYWDLWTKTAFAKRYIYYKRYVDRNPYDRYRWQSFLKLNTMWGGSPIQALIYGEQYLERFTEDHSFVHDMMHRSRAKLGDNVKLYQNQYNNISSIARSNLYIAWYEAAVRKSVNNSNKIWIEAGKNRAIVTNEQGEVMILEESPSCGKTTLLQKGEAYVRFVYDNECNLVDIVTSRGPQVHIGYNSDGKVNEIKAPEGHLFFDYNDQKQIVMWRMGEDTVKMEYDSQGEVSSIYSEKGYSTTMKLMGAIKTMSAYAKIPGEAYTLLPKGGMPDFSQHDPTYEQLKEAYDPYAAELDHEAGLKLGEYLLANLSADADYSSQLLSLCWDHILALQEAPKKTRTKYIFSFAELFHSDLVKTRQYGVPNEYWEFWVDLNEWMVSERKNERNKSKYYKALVAFEERVQKQPVERLLSSNWLIKDPISLESFWSEINPATLLDQELWGQMQLQCVYERSGVIYIGTNKGLLVKDEIWEWFGFDGIKKRWVKDIKLSKLQASSSINAIEYFGDDHLLVGTEDGLLVWNVETDEVDKIGVFQGLKSNRILDLNTISSSSGDHLSIIATTQGMHMLDTSMEISEAYGLETTVCRQILYKDGHFILATDDGVKAWYGDSLVTLSTTRSQHVAVDEDGSVIYLTDEGLYKIVEKENGYVSLDVQTLSGQPVTSERGMIYGLTSMQVGDETAVAALTDMGISIYHNKHFEHLLLPTGDGSVTDVRKYLDGEDVKVALSSDRIYLYDRRHTYYSPSVASSFVSLENGRTVKVDGREIEVNKPWDLTEFHEPYIEYAASSFYNYFYGSGYTSHVTKVGENTILFNSDEDICLGEVGNNGKIMAYALFPIDEDTHEKYPASGYNDIVNMTMDKDGGVWVSTEQYLYHYYVVDTAEYLDRFCYFDDAEQFPAQTDELGPVIVLPDGRIWVSASDNDHRKYRNIDLGGGLLEWDRETNTFFQLETSGQGFYPFLTEITQIDEDEAILSSTGGFQMYSNGQVRDLYARIPEGERNPSYARIREENRSLFLATAGAQLGDMWIFGTPSGLVGYHNEQWVRLDKLNRLLPGDLELSEYGSRHIEAVSVDTSGNIYVSNHVGTLIYHHGNEDPTSLFIDDQQELDQLIAYKQAKSLQHEQKLIKALPAESNAAKLIGQIEKNREEISDIMDYVGKVQEEQLADNLAPMDRDSLKEAIEAIERKNAALFLRLQQDEPALFQMLKIPPLHLMGSREKLANDECILQFITMPRELHIHFLSKERSEVVSIPIGRDTLLSMARATHRLVRSGAGVSRGMSVRRIGATPTDQLDGRLRQLYNWLIRPVENKIAPFKNVMIVPSEQLFYVPFSALIKDDRAGQAKYLVEEHNVGMLSTMYLFDLVYLMQEKEGGAMELFGDPDGSLPGARAEVEAIGALHADAHLYVGSQADRSAFRNCASQAGVVHLATHGKMDSSDISNSSLLFNDGLLTLPELYTLKMPSANMIVLSACESGVGKEGLEYSTLARAFTNAGIPRILATLWQVNDEASKEMMVEFYKQMEERPTKLAAFGEAQRKMIQDPRFADKPYLWSGYYFIGKP